jgi:hypothetical protein
MTMYFETQRVFFYDHRKARAAARCREGFV